MNDAVFISSLSGVFVEINEAFARFHRFGSKAECLRSFSEYPDLLEATYPDGRPAPVEEWPVLRALRGESDSNFLIWIKRKDTGETWAGSYSFAPILDGQGAITGAVVVARDITDQMKRDLELKQAMAETSRFTYAVTHDLRSPLVTIRTFVGYLRQDMRKADPAEMEADFGYIEGAAEKMGQLLDELLELSRVGRVKNPSEVVPMQTLVAEAMALVAGRLNVGGVQVRVTPVPVLLLGDRSRLREVFQNLLDNAAKFMGGQTSPQVEVGLDRSGPEPVLFVRDNGAGIDPRHITKLFGLFQQLDPDAEGTGIGLATARRIVELHGGRIWVESPGPGQGATFKFTLAGTRVPVISGGTP